MTQPTNQPNSLNATPPSAAQPPEQGGDGQDGTQVVAVSNTQEQPQTSASKALVPAEGAGAAEASGSGGDATVFKQRKRDQLAEYFRPMTKERFTKKLDKAWQHNKGILAEIDGRVTELSAFNYTMAPEEK
ncbi:MAG: hypothetical protein ACRC1U_02725, partial [Vibrionaceae bacterium]